MTDVIPKMPSLDELMTECERIADLFNAEQDQTRRNELEAEFKAARRKYDTAYMLRALDGSTGINCLNDLLDRVIMYITYKAKEVRPVKLSSLNRRFGPTCVKFGVTAKQVVDLLVMSERIAVWETKNRTVMSTIEMKETAERVAQGFEDVDRLANFLARAE